ncbi:type I DNA topoisomerase [candidate division WOR-3 bacterium]|nr:type I DNA topoisomerase [candidate division WOR-3 bacterium]
MPWDGDLTAGPERNILDAEVTKRKPKAVVRKAKAAAVEKSARTARKHAAPQPEAPAAVRGSGKDLLIVESPTKARTIEGLLKGRMDVLSSRGHISDLPKSRLGVDVEHGFKPDYIRIVGKAKVINELRAAAKKAATVYIGCDPDREGEAIAYSVAYEVAGEGTKQRPEGRSRKSKAEAGPDIRRVLFYEITKKGVEAAFKEPLDIDMQKVYSHRARRVLDRLVGYLVSPLLWRIVKRGASAGRVQTVALRLIVEREREIEGFKPEEYWVVKAVFAKKGGERFEAVLARVRGADAKPKSAAEVEAVRQACAKAEFRVAAVKSRERHRKPLPPFITATLQQDAAQRLGLPARRTMRLAQELFEGIKLGDETAGLITYPRTDSFRVADDVVAAARELVGRRYGADYLPEKPRHHLDRKGAQGAHEAIHPTRPEMTPDAAGKFLTPDQLRLYDLIYRRFLASQMADSVYALTEVSVAGGECEFRADALRCRFPGFEQVYGDPDKEKSLPVLSEGEPVRMEQFLPEQKFTQPPARYTEATLIKRLETNGIGRPSTYATIVSTLFDRKYVERKEARLAPTELGTVVNDVLVPRFANVFEVQFTREMEKELDRIEEGQEKWQEVVGRLYKPLREDLDKMEADVEGIKGGLRPELDEKCPTCGASLAERWGRFGKFVACSRYPECKYIKKPEPKLLEEKCPKCGKPLVERTGRYGPFRACSGYPECEYIAKKQAAVLAVLEEKCPKCGKPLAQKHGRFGKFVACSGYPECKYIKKAGRAPPKLLDEKCPQCGKPLAERKSRFGLFIGCTGYPECKYIKKTPKKRGPKPRGVEAEPGPEEGGLEDVEA